MELNTNNNELAIAEYKLVIISNFLHNVKNFSDENLIDFFRLLSPSEQYYFFEKLSEEQKLMILAKRNVLSPDVYIACCEKTDTFKNNVSLSNPYDESKRWRKEFKAEDEFGKKIALLIAILKNRKDKGQELEKILSREKRKKLWKQILFFCIFAFCSASFGIGNFVGGFFAAKWLAFIVESSIVLSAATLGAVGYSKLQESYLRESKLIKMLNWMKENKVFEKNKKISEPPIITHLNNLEEKDSDKKNNKVYIYEKFSSFKPSDDITKNLSKIGDAKNKKSKFKKVAKIIFYISIFLVFAAALGSLLFIPGAVALMPFAVSMFALKNVVITLVMATVSAFIISKFLHVQVQKEREAIKDLRTKSPLNKEFSEKIFNEAAENLSKEPNLENEEEKETIC